MEPPKRNDPDENECKQQVRREDQLLELENVLAQERLDRIQKRRQTGHQKKKIENSLSQKIHVRLERKSV